MPRRASLLLALAFAAPAPAQQVEGRAEYERLMERRKPTPAIPPSLRSVIVAASPERLDVRGLAGQTIAVDIGWYDVSDFALLREGRFLGMALIGYEADGYLMVDRTGSGDAAAIETGAMPTFSPDGRFFASARITPAGFNNLEGIGLWEVLPGRTAQRFFTDSAIEGNDWRIDGWPRPDCVAMSAVAIDWHPAQGEDEEAALLRAPRRHYGIELGETIAFHATLEAPACAHDEEPENDG